jgi:hypothetical protein
MPHPTARRAPRRRLGDHPIEDTFAAAVLFLTLLSVLCGFQVLSSESLWEFAQVAGIVLALGMCIFSARRRTACLVAAALVGVRVLTSMGNGSDAQGPGLAFVAVAFNLLALCLCMLLFMPRVPNR